MNFGISLTLVGLLALFGVIGVQQYRINSVNAQLSESKRKHTDDLLKIQKAKADAEVKARQDQAVMQDRVNLSRGRINDLLRHIRDQENAIRMVRVDVDRLRKLPEFANPPSINNDSLPACRDRSTALATDVATCAGIGREILDLAAQCAAAHDARAAEVRECVSAWPKISP